MIARPTPRPTQTSTKSATPRAAPDCASAMAARLTSFSKTTGVCRSSRSAASRPRCQRGRSKAKAMSPVAGSTRPGVPSTTRRTLSRARRPGWPPRTTAVCTTPTGSSVSRWSLDPADHRTGDVGAGGDHPVRPDVHADDVGAARHDGVELGVRAAPAGLLADPGDQPALLQPLDQLRGGDLGQAGQLAELGAGQRAAFEQQLQRRTVVDRPQQAGRAGQPGRTHSGTSSSV